MRSSLLATTSCCTATFKSHGTGTGGSTSESRWLDFDGWRQGLTCSPPAASHSGSPSPHSGSPCASRRHRDPEGLQRARGEEARDQQEGEQAQRQRRAEGARPDGPGAQVVGRRLPRPTVTHTVGTSRAPNIHDRVACMVVCRGERCLSRQCPTPSVTLLSVSRAVLPTRKRCSSPRSAFI